MEEGDEITGTKDFQESRGCIITTLIMFIIVILGIVILL